MNQDLILMPKSLTAENGAKSLLSGEFHETVIMQCEECEGEGESHDILGHAYPCDDCTGAGEYALNVPVGWDTIKDIYAKYAECFHNELEKNKADTIVEIPRIEDDGFCKMDDHDFVDINDNDPTDGVVCKKCGYESPF